VVIDAHHHLWQRSRGDYEWLDSRTNPGLAPIERDYLLEDYQRLAAANGIAGSVLVQAAQTSAETRWLLAQAHASNGLVLGVVGWIDMGAGDAPDVLSALAQDPLLRSIRPMLQDIPDVDWVLQPRLAAAFRALLELGLSFEVLIRPPHLRSSLTLLTRYPDLRAIIDHCAKPDIAGGMWRSWADGMRRIALETRAYCKLSGLVTEARPDWKIDDLRPYVEHVVECFGPQRVIWGSDWPVMTLNSDYARWLDAAKQLIAPLSPSDQSGIMGGNAMRFYRLEAAEPGCLAGGRSGV
jgi:L-fuconolactonase